ncbi:MAG: stimulus-sensing domain-containing protein [Rhodospirillales bacterium]
MARWRRLNRRKPQPLQRRRRRWFSPLVRGMLLVNLVGPGILLFGLLYLERYETQLIESELGVLKAQATLVAEALGESAGIEQGSDRGVEAFLQPELAKRLVNRFAGADRPRVRIFTPASGLLVDSRRVLGGTGLIQIENLPPPNSAEGFEAFFNKIYDGITPILERFIRRRPLYSEGPNQIAFDYPEVVSALSGKIDGAVRRLPDGRLILSATSPTRRFKQVIGAVMLSHEGKRVATAVRAVRYDILRVFAIAVCLSFLASLYLGSAISRPLRVLANAVDRNRGRGSLDQSIPDLSPRNDEIGDLSIALREMTEAIKNRMTATEQFAADVAHEIKNPLTSLKSAVETVSRVSDESQRQRLLEVIRNDVDRLDRLISDISDASRLDAEMSREELELVDLLEMLRTLMEIETATLGAPQNPQLQLDISESLVDGAPVKGVELRLGQVFRNLIANARSFSPKNGRIDLRLSRVGNTYVVAIEDNGPGIPIGKEDAIFDRFYSERPANEAFGEHSGLGLSISRQIVEAHGGSIIAENRRGADNAVIGARFVVSLPAAPGELSRN